MVLLSKSSKADRLDGAIVPIDGFCCCVYKTDHAVLQFGCINNLLVITGLDNDVSLALEGGMLHFMHCLNHQLKEFLLIMFKGGLSSSGTIADNRNFGNMVIVHVRNFFDASGSGVPDKKIFEKRLLGRESLTKDGSIDKRGQIREGVGPKPFCGHAAGVAVLLVAGSNESYNDGFYLAVRLGLLNDVGH